MKQLLILSGKGGTGKTTTASAFIRFAHPVAYADCDVDAPNLHLIHKPQGQVTVKDYYGSDKAVIDQDLCIRCGLCYQHCHFDSIIRTENSYTVDLIKCEGCGVCEAICPAHAVTLQKDLAGELTLVHSDQTFCTATLKMGRGNSGKLVSEVKKEMLKQTDDGELAIIDGSPGIGCPVISSISGVDFILIVTEPSLSGLSDLDRIVRTAATFRTPCAVCVNKYDTHKENTEKIRNYCTENAIPFAGCIPFDPMASKAINNGQTLADIDCPARVALYSIYNNVIKLMQQEV